ncbi:hypothetical protein BAZSYMA_ACONTIG00984_3 [Bathymodiolus azoricus thioautotrophic gill symbiont]|uniref:Uncharacterized protein n=1 Tax=Bathymodiolus azoricus thioautotrophic gill symbiont TaxID=235205 RepID=A0A1H6JWU9_9GAMM|nr:hypothetical protein BAZSYMA_ACONTIG00984_3 [Bathymodiolus azoricus thioautotrophic gill symbiont]
MVYMLTKIQSVVVPILTAMKSHLILVNPLETGHLP